MKKKFVTAMLIAMSMGLTACGEAADMNNANDMSNTIVVSDSENANASDESDEYAWYYTNSHDGEQYEAVYYPDRIDSMDVTVNNVHDIRVTFGRYEAADVDFSDEEIETMMSTIWEKCCTANIYSEISMDSFTVELYDDDVCTDFLVDGSDDVVPHRTLIFKASDKYSNTSYVYYDLDTGEVELSGHKYEHTLWDCVDKALSRKLEEAAGFNIFAHTGTLKYEWTTFVDGTADFDPMKDGSYEYWRAVFEAVSFNDENRDNDKKNVLTDTEVVVLNIDEIGSRSELREGLLKLFAELDTLYFPEGSCVRLGSLYKTPLYSIEDFDVLTENELIEFGFEGTFD